MAWIHRAAERSQDHVLGVGIYLLHDHLSSLDILLSSLFPLHSLSTWPRIVAGSLCRLNSLSVHTLFSIFRTRSKFNESTHTIMFPQLRSSVVAALVLGAIAPVAASPNCAQGQTNSTACMDACREKMGWPGYFMGTDAWGAVVVQTQSDIDAAVQEACAGVSGGAGLSNSSCVRTLIHIFI